MKKFGLFDLIDKFSEAANGKKTVKSDVSSVDRIAASGDSNALRTPDVEPDPQYLMNAKLAAFVARHDELAKKIAEKNSKRQ